MSHTLATTMPPDQLSARGPPDLLGALNNKPSLQQPSRHRAQRYFKTSLKSPLDRYRRCCLAQCVLSKIVGVVCAKCAPTVFSPLSLL